MLSHFDPPDVLPSLSKDSLKLTSSEFDQVSIARTIATTEVTSSEVLASGGLVPAGGIGCGRELTVKSEGNGTEEEEAGRGRFWCQSASLRWSEEGGCDG